jgi:hypothetical protein
VPPLLSTMIPTEDAAQLPTADASYNMRSEAAEQALLGQIQEHNAGIAKVLDSLDTRMEQWRVDNSSSSSRNMNRVKSATNSLS